jgi:transposase
MEEGLSERKLADKFKVSKTRVNGIKKNYQPYEGLGTGCK